MSIWTAVVRLTDERQAHEGKPLVTDGPFAETREHLGRFFLVDAIDLDEAISIASRVPAGKSGTVEIRPVIEVPGLPESSARQQTTTTY